MLLQLVGKSLLTDYQRRVRQPRRRSGRRASSPAQVLETVGERTAVRELIARLVDDLIPGRDEMRARPRRRARADGVARRAHHSSLARRLKGGIDDGGDPFDVFMACQDHVVAAGRAHIEHHILDCFTKAVEACPDEQAQHTLSRLCHLYALWLIVLDRGWLAGARPRLLDALEGHAEGRAQALRRARTQAEQLVAAFAIPEARSRRRSR